MLADTEWKSLNYTQYLELIETVAKGFITLGLEESHSVGVMANNCIQWTSSSIGSIFAGGLICGIYQTSSSDIVAHLAKTSDMDILVVEDIAMLKQAIGSSSSIQQALPSVKNCVMIRGSPQDLAEGKAFNSFYLIHFISFLIICSKQVWVCGKLGANAKNGKRGSTSNPRDKRKSIRAKQSLHADIHQWHNRSPQR